MVKLREAFTIDGQIVNKAGAFQDITVYESQDKIEETITFYFVDRKNKVIQTLSVSTDCSQNVGYISAWNFSVVED